MWSPHAASAAAKLLILLTLGALTRISTSEAATKCPSGQILRVSLGICVPKAQNLEVLSKHGAGKANPVEDTIRPATPPKSGEDEALAPDTSEEPSIDIAQRATSPAADRPPAGPIPQAKPPPTPFGSLFVGAFRSTLSTGLSAFR
jgi:hypothetical protein